MEVRVKKLKNVSEAGENKFTGEMIKSGSELVVDWVWKACNMAFFRE